MGGDQGVTLQKQCWHAFPQCPRQRCHGHWRGYCRCGGGSSVPPHPQQSPAGLRPSQDSSRTYFGEPSAHLAVWQGAARAAFAVLLGGDALLADGHYHCHRKGFGLNGSRNRRKPDRRCSMHKFDDRARTRRVQNACRAVFQALQRRASCFRGFIGIAFRCSQAVAPGA